LNLAIFIIGYIFIIVTIILFTICKINPILRFGQLNKITVIIISINLFLIFLNVNIRSNKIINEISKSTFGVYLIHEHYLMRMFLWEKLFNASKISNSLKLIMYGVLATFLVYVMCTIIDFIRIKILEEKIFKVVDKKIFFNIRR